MAGGITFSVAKPILCTVIANGVSPTDPRVLSRTNEAIASILAEVIPVGGMITADVIASGTNGDELFLPKEMEAAYEVEVLGGSVNGQTDVKQGFFTIVNQFAYVDPSMAHDNPLVDLFLQPDPGDPTILRRKYQYPGLIPNATVRVTGPKRYIPITADGDYLIVQNILALKDEINAIEMRENRNNPQGAEIYHKSAIDRIQSEVKKHLLDPINSSKRKANYEADLINYPVGTFGYTRARIALEQTGALNMGKSELTRVVEQAEMALIDAGQFIGTIQEYEADVTGGLILAPKQVDTILATSYGDRPLDIKGMFFRYAQHGRWWNSCCGCGELREEGEIFYPTTGERRRQYRLNTSTDLTCTLRFVATLRWVKKAPADAMVIKNFEAMRLMSQSIINQKEEKWNEAQVAKQSAIQEVDKELTRYLSGQTVVAPSALGFGFQNNQRWGLL